MIKLLRIVVLPLCLAACASSTPLVTPTVPAKLSVPPGNKLSAVMHAKGVQIYTCQAKKDDPSQFEWTLLAPDAHLTDAKGHEDGRHYIGPTWEAGDGSKVVGKLEQKVDAPGASDIPWLLLSAKSNDGRGEFGQVTFIQRLETHGGKALAGGCDSAHVGGELRVEYQATYYFYVAGS